MQNTYIYNAPTCSYVVGVGVVDNVDDVDVDVVVVV